MRETLTVSGATRELAIMGVCERLLRSLDEPARRRVLMWLGQRFKPATGQPGALPSSFFPPVGEPRGMPFVPHTNEDADE